MSKASLLELCHDEKKYETFSIKNKGNSILPRQPFLIEQLSIACVAANNSTLNIQHSTLKFALSSEEFSCQREQSQTCLSYAECSRKSHVCKMYETFSISHEQSKLA